MFIITFLSQAAVLNDSRDLISEWLDAHYGNDITEHSVFANLAKTYAFFIDFTIRSLFPFQI